MCRGIIFTVWQMDSSKIVPAHEEKIPQTPAEKVTWVQAGTDGQERALRLMQVLRSPTGCPWDNKQSHRSLAKYLQEETQELLDILLSEDTTEDPQLQEELGDVYLQVLFHARIAEQEQRFDMGDVADGLVKKMIERHPHVFADGVADTPEAVTRNWEQQKHDRENKLFGASVPRSLPALLRAQLLGSRAAQLGFDWENREDVFAKLGEEITEFRMALKGEGDSVFHEIGDLLMVVVNLARFAGVDPEEALQAGNERFIKRFRHVLAAAGDTPHHQKQAHDWNQAWENAKRELG